MSSAAQSILIVDDELDILVIFKQALSRQGYTVFGFTNPVLALEHFKINSAGYGLVITDVRMPQMSGLELAANIKAIKPDAKVVLMSAFDVSDFEFSIPGIKTRDFLRKPVNVKTLVRRVKVAMAN
ncbi:MAG: response regulator [Thermoproteota archaeon]|nr:response regulator [Thermoproteota archaeon]